MGSEKTYIIAVSITACSIVNICNYNETRVFQVNESYQDINNELYNATKYTSIVHNNAFIRI